jgi:signal transduction histidine kinase
MLIGTETDGNLENRLPESKTHHSRKEGQRFPVMVHRRDILDERRRVIARLHMVEDLTQREQMESQLLHAERLSLLGQLAPRIAHEFKTPLQIILGQAEMALLQLKGHNTEGVDRAVQSILPAGIQMLDLVQQMTKLGKPEKSSIDKLDLKTELEKILDTLKPLGVIKYCEIVRDFESGLPRILGDPGQIEQVFRNLIVNAAHALEKTPQRVLTLTLKASPDGRQIEAGVGDTGHGIPPENLEDIFEPFFTTKPEDKGTGLGLPIVKTILDRHHATITVQSLVDEGTRFTLSFPALGAPSALEKEAKP